MKQIKPKDMDGACDRYLHPNMWYPLKFTNITGGHENYFCYCPNINALMLYSESFYFSNHHQTHN